MFPSFHVIIISFSEEYYWNTFYVVRHRSVKSWMDVIQTHGEGRDRNKGGDKHRERGRVENRYIYIYIYIEGREREEGEE